MAEQQAAKTKALLPGKQKAESIPEPQESAEDSGDEVMGSADSGMESMQEAKSETRSNRKPLTKKQRRQIQQQQRKVRQANQRARNRNRFYTDAILLGSESVQFKDFKDARVPAMNWLKHRDNPYFAKSIVNRIWAHYFGVGIVQPADDLNLANPPSNAPLLEYLADGFVENGYDLLWVHRQITNSRVYQLSWEPNETNQNDRRNFSRALPRRLPAEVVYDALTQATASTELNGNYRDETKSRLIAMAGTTSNADRKVRGDQNFAMQIFGKSDRQGSCDCDRSNETSLVQTVFMRNDRHVHQQIVREDGWLGPMIQQHQRQVLNPDQFRGLVRGEERLRKLKLRLRKAGNRDQKKQADSLADQIEQLDLKLEPIRQRRENMIQREIPEYDVDKLINEAWLRTLSRFPDERELAISRKHIQDDRDPISGITSLLWALLNTREFIVNH